MEPASALPLSSAQLQLWLFERLVGRPSNLTTAVALAGPLNLHGLEQSIRRAVARHALLRARFTVSDGTPLQHFEAEPRLSIAVVDCRTLPAAARDRAVRHQAERELVRPFDHAKAPQLRAQLLRFDAGDHVLLFTMPHIVADEWSMAILCREVSSDHAAFGGGRQSSVAKTSGEYADYVRWEADSLSGEPLKASLTFWRRQLADLPPLLPIPTDRPRPPRRSYSGAWVIEHLSEELGLGLRTLAREENTTLFAVLLAGLALLLHRQTGSRTVVIATQAATRVRTEFETLFGPFLNGVALRIDCLGNPSFRALIRRARVTLLQAMQHAHVPFTRVLEELRLEADQSYNPVAQVLLLFHRDQSIALQFDRLRSSTIDLRGSTTPFDLTFSIADAGRRLALACQYNTDIFTAQSAQLWMQRWQRLLQHAVRDREAPASELDLLTETELRTQLRDWNLTDALQSRAATVNELIDGAVARCPDAVAAACGDEQITYTALAAAANQLADRLSALGVHAECRVGICLPRSIGMLVALLGIMRAGAAYVPLDPASNAEQLCALIRDANVVCVVAREGFCPDIATLGMSILHLGRLPARARRGDGELQRRSVITARNLCYVVYTSGSTGKPKGVAIEHRSVVNLLAAMERGLCFSRHDAMLALTRLTFDISGLELLLPLVAGARVAIAPEGAAVDSGQLARLIADHESTVVQATPITWRLLLEDGWLPPRGLKILSGGEALPPRLAADLVTAGGRLWNLYGPTETTIWSTLARLDRIGQDLTIGRPIANTQAYVLDDAFRPVPAGAVGGLYIAGDGLARGYIGRPQETAESFRPNGFSIQAGARMYRTGDLARHLPDGEIEFHGRSDHQVKVRGIRIETEGISAVLDSHAGVRESVTVLVDDAARGAHLAAYVVANRGITLSHHELRSYLQRQLPSYMVPSVFVQLERLPRTPTNKIDRKALPDPDETSYGQAGDVVLPRSSTEHAIAAIWRNILLLEGAGIHNNFFALGGNSLQATRLLLRMNERLGVQISMEQFFEAPTIAALAERVDEQKRGTAALPPPQIERLPRDRFFTLAPQQERWLESELRIGRSHPNHVHLPLLLTGALDFVNLEQAVQAAAGRHEALRTCFQIRDDRCVQVIATDGGMRVPFVDLSGLPAELRKSAIARLVRVASRRPFDLRRAPLFRLHCVRLAAAEHVLLFCAQHLVCDGWSMDVLVAESVEVYRAQSRGERARFAPLPIQYVDFADWQRRWLQTPDFTSHLAFWLRQLTPPPPALFRVSNNVAADFEVAQLHCSLPAPIFEPAKRASLRQGCSVFAAALAALAFALHRDTGISDVSIGTMAANRSQTHTENVVGLLTNPVVLRLAVDAADGATAMLRHAQTVVRNAFIHQELPFDAIRHVLEQVRHMRGNELFQVMLVWHAASDRITPLPGIQSRLYSTEWLAAEIENVPSTIELFFDIREGVDRLVCLVNYKVHHFAPERVRAMFADFTAFFEKLALDADTAPVRPLPAAAQAALPVA